MPGLTVSALRYAIAAALRWGFFAAALVILTPMFQGQMTLAADADLRARLVAAGRARVESEFQWSSHVARLVTIFEAAITDGANS